MSSDPITPPGERERFAASGQPYLPIPLPYGDVPAWDPFADGEVTARYAYAGPDGEPRFEVIRFHLRAEHPAYPAKRFLSRRWDAGGGGWAWGLDGVEMVPFRLPRVLAAVAAGETVFVVEGEKDVLALEAAGLAATCNPLGGLQWRDAYAEWLRGADVVVIPDDDAVGRVHAGRVAESLRGRARSIAILRLPGVANGGDASTWLADGHAVAELRRLAAGAQRDPSPDAVAAVLGLPADADPRDPSPANLLGIIRQVTHGGGSAPAGPRVPFPRTRAAFARLGVEIPPGPSDANALYRRLRSALRSASPDRGERLEDAFALERAVHELSLVAPLLRAVAAAEDASARAWSADAPAVLSPAVRLVRTRWDWEAWLAGGAPEPAETGAAYLLNTQAGGLRVQRLAPFTAAVASLLARPTTVPDATAELVRQMDGGPPPEQVAAAVLAQVREMAAAGLVHPAPSPAARLAAGIRAWLLAAEPPRDDAATAAGVLVRTARAAAEQFEVDAGEGDAAGPDAAYRADLAAALLEGALRRARLGDAFAAELEGYWGAADPGERRRSLRPVLEALQPAMDALSGRLPPVLLS